MHMLTWLEFKSNDSTPPRVLSVSKFVKGKLTLIVSETFFCLKLQKGLNFYDEAHSKVGDVMNEKIPTVLPNTTTMEIVFMLAVNNIPKIYVVDENKKLLGVIDKTLVLERIINF